MKWSARTVLLAVAVLVVTFAATDYLMKARRHVGLSEQPVKSGVTSQLPAETVTGKLSKSHAYLHESVTALACEGNVLWVGIHDGGLIRVDTAMGNQTRFDRKNGLPSDRVLDIVVPGQGKSHAVVLLRSHRDHPTRLTGHSGFLYSQVTFREREPDEGVSG